MYIFGFFLYSLFHFFHDYIPHNIINHWNSINDNDFNSGVNRGIGFWSDGD